MAHHVETDIKVQRFGFTGDETGKRLHFPHVDAHDVEGRSGSVAYGAGDCIFEKLEGRLDTFRWLAEAASLGGAWVRDDAGRFDVQAQRLEMPHGLMMTSAQSGVEIVSPHVSLSEMTLTVNGPFGRSSADPAPAPPPGEPATLRPDRLRFLDSLSGRIDLTVKVVLDLPVLGRRTLDQQLKVPIQEGSLDFRALDDNLDWLEGAFLDIKHEGDKLAVQWKVPIFGSSHDLIRWRLDTEASTLASFGRVPVRSLTEFRLGSADDDDKPDGRDASPKPDKKRKILESLSIEAIDIVLSLLAPRSYEVGGGLIMFGGEDQPGMVDLKVSGGISDRGPGTLQGAIGSIDTTIKDLRLGPVLLTADRLHFDGLDGLEVTFDGFRPAKVKMVVHRVTATNLAMRLGGDR